LHYYQSHIVCLAYTLSSTTVDPPPPLPCGTFFDRLHVRVFLHVMALGFAQDAHAAAAAEEDADARHPGGASGEGIANNA